MIPALVQQLGNTFNKTAGTTLAHTFSGTTTAGNLIIARVLFDNFTTASKPIVSSITKPGGETNSWALLGAARSTSTSGGAFASGELWAIRTTVAWSGSFTVTLDSSVTMKAIAYTEFSGATATLRSTVGTAYSTTTTAASATTTGTAPVANDLAIGFIFGSNVATVQAGSNNTTGGSWNTGPSIGSTGSGANTNNFGVGQYKATSSTSHLTHANSAAMTAGNGSIIAILQSIPDPVLTQVAYRFYADGTETGSTALAAQDTAPTVDLSSGDVNLQLRVCLQSTTSADVQSTDDFQLQWEKNASGTWIDIGSNAADFDGNQVWTDALPWTNTRTGYGQSFTGTGVPLRQANFYMYKVGTPPGDLTAQLFAHSGTFGTSSVPTGSALATSASMPASSALVDPGSILRFTFDSPYTPANATNYVIAVMVSSLGGSSTDHVVTTYDNGTTEHEGNAVSYNGTTWSSVAADMFFGVAAAPTDLDIYNSSFLTDAAATTNRLVVGESLTDSYSIANSNSTWMLTSTGDVAGSQSFSGNGQNLVKAEFCLSTASGSPVGTITAQLFAHTGTFGGGGSPVGAALATSSTTVSAATLPGTPTMLSFNFAPVLLTSGTPYCIAAVWNGATSAGNVNIHLDNSSPTHAGNMAFQSAGGSWAGFSNYDAIFGIYTNPVFQAGKISEDGLVDNMGWTGNNCTELLYSFTVKQAGLANGDTLRFRILRNAATTGMTYTQVPTINIAETTVTPYRPRNTRSVNAAITRHATW